jgi:transcriptional regulator GlxA family with amidase domain
MLARSGGFVTAGGFLAAVDLALALVERETARPTSRELGRLVLADSARQHQSIYATSLVDTPTEDPRMQRLERWLQAHLAEAITVDDMAAVCRLEPRTFRRAFGRAYGFSPKKLLQLKRIEKVRTLLRRSDLSLEDVVGQVGVSDVPSFRKVFQRELGVSPAEYRRQIRLRG